MPSILASPSSPPATAPATPPLAMAEGAAEALSRKLKSILDWSRPSVYSPNERRVCTNRYPQVYVCIETRKELHRKNLHKGARALYSSPAAARSWSCFAALHAVHQGPFCFGLNARNAETVWYTVWTMYC